MYQDSIWDECGDNILDVCGDKILDVCGDNIESIYSVSLKIRCRRNILNQHRNNVEKRILTPH